MPTNPGAAADRLSNERQSVPFAIVHHANQYIISDGYTNRSGIQSVAGSAEDKRGLAYILQLHRTYKIPANIHFSGTLIEALAWHQPQCLALLKKLYDEELVEIVGSAYSQNIMKYFDHAYNVAQINEHLDLCRTHLGVEAAQIKSFWPPERVWDTSSMAAALRDPALRNGGFQSVLVDDRLLLPVSGAYSPRHLYDRNPNWDPELFQPCRIRGGDGLLALPIALNLRQCIPPRTPEQEQSVEAQLRWIRSLHPGLHAADLLAIYADDMEKPAAIGWDPKGPSQFESFLCWLSEAKWITPVKISDWVAPSRIGPDKNIEGGTYVELATNFDAGEQYEKWYFDPRWDPYREYCGWARRRVQHLAALGAGLSLIELAEKHLLASSWETAWHTPADGAHGRSDSDGGPSASSRAVASHSRHAAMIAEAAYWQTHKDGGSHCYLYDVDNDGDEEVVLKNRNLFAVLSPKRGGRLVALFAVDGEKGAQVVGNPCDDWNLKEELHDYMDIPPNHPGALADVGFEHDSYRVEIVAADGAAVRVRLVNDQPTSLAFGLVKELGVTSFDDHALAITYRLPQAVSGLGVEFGLSPDYLNLLRKGRSILAPHQWDGARGWGSENVIVWVKPVGSAGYRWEDPYQAAFGHGCAFRLAFEGRSFGALIGIERPLPAASPNATLPAGGQLT